MTTDFVLSAGESAFLHAVHILASRGETAAQESVAELAEDLVRSRGLDGADSFAALCSHLLEELGLVRVINPSGPSSVAVFTDAMEALIDNCIV